MRVCTKCLVSKSESAEFFRCNERYVGGLTRWCIDCSREYARKHNEVYRKTEEGKERHRQDSAVYRQRHPKKVKEQAKQGHLKFRDAHLQRMKEYNNTIGGYLRHVFGDIKRRIANPVEQNKCYKDIKNMFRSSDEFVDYVINKLQIDPRGKQIHRIDSRGNYEKGNITFLVPAEHCQLHIEERRQKDASLSITSY